MGTNSSKNQKKDQKKDQSDDTPKATSRFFAVFFRKKAKYTASSEQLQGESVQAKEKEPEKIEPKKAEPEKSEPDILPEDDDIDHENALLGYKAVARRMAVSTAQPQEKASETPSFHVEMDIVYQVPRSKVIVNPFDFDTKSQCKVMEKTVKAVDTDYAVKNILYELFKPQKEPRRSWKKA